MANMKVLLGLLLPIFCQCALRTGNFVEHFNGTFGKDAPTVVKSLSDFYVSGMRFEFEYNFTFPTSACCPMLNPVSAHAVSYTLPCYPKIDDKLLDLFIANSNALFKLSPESNGAGMRCEYSKDELWIACKGKSEQLYYKTSDRPILLLGYECAEIQNLEGFSYNIKGTFSTSTMCEPLEVSDCPDIQYTSFPTPLGQRNVHEAKATLAYLEIFNIAPEQDKSCFEGKVLQKLACNVVFYKCTQPGRQTQLILPCKESCEQFKQACGNRYGIFTQFNCSYHLPNAKESNCEYFEVTCPTPPNITNGFIKNLRNRTYFPALAEIDIGCENGYNLVGRNQSVCGYGGYWLNIPQCKQPNATTYTIAIIAGISSCSLIAILIAGVFLAYYIRKIRQAEKGSFDMVFYGKRNKKYDVFVSYCDDARYKMHPQRDIIYNTVLPFLEKMCKPPFSVFVHPRDFLAGELIKANIIQAIKNSNAILIFMTHEYVASHWCRDEFEEAVHENREDPAFRILVVMVEPKENLGELTPYIGSFLDNKVYLTEDDPHLWSKIQNILVHIRGDAQETQTHGNAVI